MPRFLLFVLVPAVFTAACAKPALTTSIATTAEVMSAVVEPSSTAVFRAASNAPQADADWVAVRAQALVLAESGNLLLVGSRLRDADEWARAAAALREAAHGAATAAETRNAAALEAAGEKVYETCEQCHSRYMAAR
jgi:hypothetical protein